MSLIDAWGWDQLCPTEEPKKKKTRKKNKDGYVLKSEVQLIIQNYIRSIQMNDYGNDEGVTQLYDVMKQIEKMPIKAEL